MTKSNNWQRVLHAWVLANGLDPNTEAEGSVTRAVWEAAWRYSRMTWKAAREELVG